MSVMLEGEYGISGVVLEVPAHLGRSGLLKVENLRLTLEENAQLNAAAEAIRTRRIMSIRIHKAGGRFEEVGSYALQNVLEIMFGSREQLPQRTAGVFMRLTLMLKRRLLGKIQTPCARLARTASCLPCASLFNRYVPCERIYSRTW